jgi:hypothetical protein
MFIYRGYNGRGPMMLVSFIIDGNRQEGTWLVVKHNALRWVKTNNAPSKRSPWQIPIAHGMIVTSRLQWL